MLYVTHLLHIYITPIIVKLEFLLRLNRKKSDDFFLALNIHFLKKTYRLFINIFFIRQQLTL